MEPINLAEVYVDERQEVITQPPICEATNIQWLDTLEYHMGLKRLAANSLGKCNKSFQVTARADVFQSLCTGQCALLSAFDTIGAVETLFWDNYKAGTHQRVLFDKVIPSSDNYVYTLFFDKGLHSRTASGALCESGKTRVTTTLHPFIAAVLASRFKFTFHQEHVLELIIQDRIRPFTQRPIWESFFDPPEYFGRPVEWIAEDPDDRNKEAYARQTALLAEQVQTARSLCS